MARFSTLKKRIVMRNMVKAVRLQTERKNISTIEENLF